MSVYDRLRELSEALGVPRSSLHALLRTLAPLTAAAQDLGPALLGRPSLPHGHDPMVSWR